jgi:hypothetical protein
MPALVHPTYRQESEVTLEISTVTGGPALKTRISGRIIAAASEHDKLRAHPAFTVAVLKAPYIGADGVVGSTTAYFIDQHHPVCAIKGGFAAFD